MGLPEPTVSASLVFGRAIHQAVEYHFNELLAGNEPPTLGTLLAGRTPLAWGAYPAQLILLGFI
jgi:hypothetical protein